LDFIIYLLVNFSGFGLLPIIYLRWRTAKGDAGSLLLERNKNGYLTLANLPFVAFLNLVEQLLAFIFIIPHIAK